MSYRRCVNNTVYLHADQSICNIGLHVGSVCMGATVWIEEGSAHVATVITTVILCLIPLGLYQLTSLGGHPLTHWINALSPAWAPWLIHSRFFSIPKGEFQACIGLTLCWAIFFFALAGAWSRAAWEREMGKEKHFTRLRSFLALSCLHSKGTSNKLSLLKKNPCLWLSLRNKNSVQLGWITFFVITIIIALCFLVLPRSWRSGALPLIGASINLFALEWLVHYEAAKRMGSERHSQTLESILTTPLTIEEIVDGNIRALTMQFHPLFAATIGFNLVLLIIALFSRSWTPAALFDLLLIWGLLLFWGAWRARTHAFDDLIKPMWISFCTGSPTYGIHRSMWTAYNLFFQFINCLNLVMIGIKEFPSGHLMEIIIISIIALVVLCCLIYKKECYKDTSSYKLRMMFLRDFRQIVSTPLPNPNDPNLKKWDFTKGPLQFGTDQ